jgi:hypothetical protein
MISVNCVPLNVPCRIGTWKLSITFSQCYSQLQGTMKGPPVAAQFAAASTVSPGRSTSSASKRGSGGCFSGGPIYAKIRP